MSELTLLTGDCRDVLATLEAASVQAVITSPPYFGLRDYGTAQWEGGDVGCDHLGQPLVSTKSTLRLDGREHLGPYGGEKTRTNGTPYRSICAKCGARRIDAQLGLEPLHDCLAWARAEPPCAGCYVCALRGVFAQVKRVLRDDGVVFLNLGSSYASRTISSRMRYNLREDLTYQEQRDVCMGMFGVRFDGYEAESERTVPPVLSPALHQSTEGSRPTIPLHRVETKLPDTPGETDRSRDSETAPLEMGNNRSPGRGMRVLRGSGARVYDDRSYQRGRRSTPESPNGKSGRQFGQDLQGHQEPRLSEGQVSGAVLELQLLNRCVGILSSSAIERELIPENLLPYFKLATPHIKPKDDLGIPWRVALALQADGWYLRADNVWDKGNPMPESVRDRTTRSHEYVFMLAKSARYYYDAAAIAEPSVSNHPSGNGYRRPQQISRDGRGSDEQWTPTATRNARSVWRINTVGFAGAHFATFPPALVERCLLAGTSAQACELCGAPWARVVDGTKYEPPTAQPGERFVDASRGDKTRKLSGKDYNDQVRRFTTGWAPTCRCENTGAARCTVLDPFGGSGTVGRVAIQHNRHAVLIDLNGDYTELQKQRTNGVQRRLELS